VEVPLKLILTKAGQTVIGYLVSYGIGVFGLKCGAAPELATTVATAAKDGLAHAMESSRKAIAPEEHLARRIVECATNGSDRESHQQEEEILEFENKWVKVYFDRVSSPDPKIIRYTRIVESEWKSRSCHNTYLSKPNRLGARFQISDQPRSLGNTPRLWRVERRRERC